MTTRAEALARRFAAANDELIALLERATPEQWRQRTEDEGELRAVGVIADHVALAHPRILGLAPEQRAAILGGTAARLLG